MACSLATARRVDLDRIVRLVETRFGYSTPKQQFDLLSRTIDLILDGHKYDTEEFLHLLGTLPVDAPMIQAVLSELTNNETYFFRDPPTMESLINVVLPELISRRRTQRVLRVWSAGCSTGEELYTISILLHEQIPDFEAWTIELVGTDIDDTVVQKARRAEYGERALRATSEAARQRYFEKIGKALRLRQKFRQGVRFEVHNLVDPKAAPPAGGRFDLVMCRNVTIYFVQDGLERITENLALAMAEDGIWVAAPSDPKPPSRFATRVLPGLLLNTLGTDAVEQERPTPAKKSRNTVPATPSSKRHPDLSRVASAEARPAEARPVVEQHPPQAPRPLPRELAELELATRLADEGRLQDALEVVREVAAANPLAPEAHGVEATLLESLGDVDGALAALRRALYLDPSKIEAHVRTSLLLQRIGDRKGAIRALRNAIAAGVGAPKESDGEYRVFATHHLMRLLAEEKE